MASVFVLAFILAACLGQVYTRRLSKDSVRSLRSKMKELRAHHVHLQTKRNTEEILTEAMNSVSSDLINQPLSSMSPNIVADQVSLVISHLVTGSPSSMCTTAATTELLIGGMLKQLEWEFSEHRPDNMYSVVYAWCTNNTHRLNTPYDMTLKATSEEISKIILTPVINLIEELDKTLDVIKHEDQFYGMQRRVLMGPNVVHLSLSDALQAVFTPANFLEFSSNCNQQEALDELDATLQKARTYLTSTLSTDFSTMFSDMTPPMLGPDAANHLLAFLYQNYNAPTVIDRMMKMSVKPPTGNADVDVLTQCARTIVEIFFSEVWNPSSSMPLTSIPTMPTQAPGHSPSNSSTPTNHSSPSTNTSSIFPPNPDAPATPSRPQHSKPVPSTPSPTKPTPSTDEGVTPTLVPGFTDISMLLQQHHSDLVQAGVSDVSPMAFLTTFLEMLLTRAQEDGINRVMLTRVIMSVVEDIGNSGSEVFSQHAMSSRPEQTRILKSMLDQMELITDDLRKLLERP